MRVEQEGMNILDKIISLKESLPNKQKKLCDYVLQHHQDIGLLTVKELAEKADVGTTTVLRFVKLLGFDSFFDLRKEFHNIQKDYSDKWESVQRSFGGNGENKEFKILSSVWHEGMHILDQSLNPQLVEGFNQAMELIVNADRINLLGLRPYKAVALYLEVLIEEFHSKTRQLSFDGESMFDRILQFEKNEVFIIFSFSPYVQRTIEAASIAYEKSIPIILITDYLSCPIASFSNVILKLEPSEKHFSIIPIIALVEAIVIELGKRKSKTAIPKIRTLVETLKEKKIIVD
ncbi:MurR/RpiR family transcriptional regulator [Schinkia azotoformans]|uniref:MurR/RpiR family transcriptional regulator n=1 Tax=Schinkia azotoformans TaxID=1454 RepID=UPI002DBC78AF|nr:MurR/RpiR family transcriptional regulator [Schinkia azotoformans]MEC1719011.1 MurR/RpiR family transcriptional regulator [Schinkia azotoformans]MED4352233.1 MurR/RpiR family transcriptional regulator [Schinkia azotoformans]MED4411959.1 MurR/RpiR family transcriptional regulator [Schinkia azotoformans]